MVHSSSTWLANWCWLLAGALGSVPLVLLLRDTWGPHHVAAAFLQTSWPERQQDRRHHVFYDIALVVTVVSTVSYWLHRSNLRGGEWHRIQTPGSENRSGCAEGWLPGVDSLVIPSLQMREQTHRVIKQNAEGAMLSGRAGSWMNTLSPACMLFRGLWYCHW